MINACLDGSNEYFNGSEWKPISNYQEGSEEKVLQYNSDGTATLVTPSIFVSECNDTPVYESKDGNVPTMCTADANVVFKEKGKLFVQRFSDFFKSRDVTESCNLVGSCVWSVDMDTLCYKDVHRLVKAIRKNNIKYLKKDIKLLDYVSIISDRICLSSKFMTTGTITKKILLQELGLNSKIGYVPFDCGCNYKLADQLWTLYQLSGEGKRCYVTEFEGDYYLYKPHLLDDGMYAPDDVEISTSGSVYYSYFRKEIGEVLGRESSLFSYNMSTSKKYGIGVESGMLVLRRKGTMFIMGC